MAEHGAEAEHVAEFVGSVSREPFRTRVPIVRSAALPRLRVPIESKTDELDTLAAVLTLGGENGSRRDIAMNDPDPVGRPQAGGGLEADTDHLVQRQRTSGGQHVRQQLARQKFADSIWDPLGGFAHVKETSDVWMAYLARSSKLGES